MSGVDKKDCILICDASENNLKNISVAIPLNSLSCVTGPSGCGKSSLVYDTLYAESQRNFLESMSGNMYGQKLVDKPKVTSISNLRPALNVSQNYYNVNPRSTIGTVTDISYYIRAIFALIANEQCHANIDTNYFSPNNPLSCCCKCKGLGEEYSLSEDLLIPDKTKSLESGGILYYKGSKTSVEYRLLEAECEYFGIDIAKKVQDLSESEREALLYREEDIGFTIRFKTPKGRIKQKTIYRKGAVSEIRTAINDIDTPSTFSSISKYLVKVPCSSCKGSKLKKDVLDYIVAGKNIAEVEHLEFADLLVWLRDIEEEYSKTPIKRQLLSIVLDVKRRIESLISLNLDYLCLERSIPSLSNGEVQRVRIASQLSCALSGIVYILDEPCKGLHFRNTQSIIDATRRLVDKGNTVIAIEHNKQFISNATTIIELGPVGGPSGGYITNIVTNPKEYTYELNFKTREKANNYISFYDVNYHNLKGIDVSIPLGKTTCISGISGSGKSSLSAVIASSCELQRPINCGRIKNCSEIKKVLYVNQQPIGKTPRSTVVSYLGIYDTIRELFAKTDMAKTLKLSASDFSMNVAGGRCEKCQGTGKVKIELSFIPESYVVCSECRGSRFHSNVLSVKYEGHTINDVLNEPIETVLQWFEHNIEISSVLRCMVDIGLGYISLGQMSMNLSGGEAQRIKLAKCLGTKHTGNVLYILDEPTSGLNEKDVLLLERIISQLNKSNETVLIIEHDIEFIVRVADYLIDLGTVAGSKGGTTLLQGIPSEVMANNASSWAGFTVTV